MLITNYPFIILITSFEILIYDKFHYDEYKVRNKELPPKIGDKEILKGINLQSDGETHAMGPTAGECRARCL